MTKFEKQCRKVAEQVGVEVDVIYDSSKRRQYYDDGFLHIVSGRGLRACFSVDSTQDDPVKGNQLTRLIMDKMGLKVTDGVLNEDEWLDDTCPHCGCDCGNY